ncbi:MAG: UDP-N-acetylglucosamine 2-epimerase (non-hydrolyzing) [Bacteroidales bacterium]|nr:UDP-N-acetylglucosamine 2-epimerase (non-hydrolyzing) [Bacteroidales bacterium]
MKIKILTIIGARPQIIKAAAVSRAVRNCFSDRIEEKILHTGQHYDTGMSQVFFDELGIPHPDYNLNVGSGKHGEQTAKMIEGIENVLLSEHFDGVILYGDTNSTLAGAVAASKLHVPVYHIEAGLRSFNMSMPEEINRVVCDNLSTVLFAPTETAVVNLKREGLADSKARFADGRRHSVVNLGDVMYDNSMHFASVADSKSDIMKRLDLQPDSFILVTVHRDNNTDIPERLTSIVKALVEISKNKPNHKIVMPLHPRTAKMLPQNVEPRVYEEFKNCLNVACIPPVSFFDIIVLEKNASVVLTDSGGVQKEAYFYGRPCVIMRPETEWVEITDAGAGIIADADTQRIVAATDVLLSRKIEYPEVFGDSRAAEHILQYILDNHN